MADGECSERGVGEEDLDTKDGEDGAYGEGLSVGGNARMGDTEEDGDDGAYGEGLSVGGNANISLFSAAALLLVRCTICFAKCRFLS